MEQELRAEEADPRAEEIEEPRVINKKLPKILNSKIYTLHPAEKRDWK